MRRKKEMITENEAAYRETLIAAKDTALAMGVTEDKANEIGLDLFLTDAVKAKNPAKWYYMIEDHHGDLGAYAKTFTEIYGENT